MVTKSIGIVGYDESVIRAFGGLGFCWLAGSDPDNLEGSDVNLLVFTGGEDVDPSFYGEKPEPYTNFNTERDVYEAEFFNNAVELGVPMVGICRGSQFLNVMNGGTLHQHVTNHGLRGTHPIWTKEGIEVHVTSTHHQMIKDYPGGELLAYAKEWKDTDVEVVWFPKTKCLCVQFHPEYMDSASPGFNYFQNLVKRYVL